MALYKEVQQLYDRGLEVPEDITILYSDDNFGTLRRIPTEQERKRPGGVGVRLSKLLHAPNHCANATAVLLSFPVYGLPQVLQMDEQQRTRE